MRLVDNWKQGWKWVSVHALAVAGVLPATWESLPHRWQDAVPLSAVATATAITAAVGIIGRLVDQQPARPDATDKAGA